LSCAISARLAGKARAKAWFSELDAAAAAKLSVALVGLEQGNTSNAKSVGEGVLEYRIDWGPGYRVNCGRDREVLVILLTGGAKQRRQRDIERTKELWASGGESRRRNERGERWHQREILRSRCSAG
jgi:putative addiction module killer protein